MRPIRVLTVLATTLALASAVPAAAQPTGGRSTPAPSATGQPVRGVAGQPALGAGWQPPAAVPARTGTAAGQVLALLSPGTTVTGTPLPAKHGARTAATSDAATNAALRKVDARSIRPVLPTGSTDLTGASRSALGSTAPDLSRLVVVDTAGTDATAAADALGTTPGVAFAEPDRYVTSMSTTPTPVPAAAGHLPVPKPAASTPSTPDSAALPSNYGLATSLQSYLNAGGVDAVGAYQQLGARYGQLPGAGEIITNVSVGDLTDQSMADAGDSYVRQYGPTTVVTNGQRYLDLPSMPLIPTYTAAADGTLDPTGSTEGQDPALSEVMLDFGVMAPLPHDQQRPDATGSGLTDLLGIAPGAKYRLVIPQQPTFDQIATALVAAANQKPRPNVITASLGFGTDTAGFPGRYLEDDPLLRAVVAGIVRHYGIVVSISANDGTRLYTPASVGPDGGSTPTDRVGNAAHATSIDDDAYSTTPSLVPDSGAIAAGGTTLDDTLAVSPRSDGPLASTGTLAETRISGGGNFSSGFGTRIDLSAPSDGIVVYEHTNGQPAQAVTPVFSGGTSASAPEIAAAAAVVLQAARLTGRHLDPAEVRSLLERTGRAVPTPPQIDRPLQVGPQIDISAAVSSLLPAHGQPAIVRVSVAHRVTQGGLGGTFLEESDPGRLELAGTSGEGLLGPVTFGLDTVGLPARGPLEYRLRVGDTEFGSTTPSIRVLPTDLLTAAGLPVVATAD
ncbi:MAG TPA: S8 family serine peptidase, partial [Jatrophihabitantaceae bacterium]